MVGLEDTSHPTRVDERRAGEKIINPYGTEKRSFTMFKSDLRRDALLFCGLLVFGVICGAWVDIPNVKPIAAIALFGGVVLGRTYLAVACPLAIIGLTVFGQAVASWPIQLTIAAGLLSGVCAGRWVRHRGLLETSMRHSRSVIMSLAASSVACSIAFYLVSNWGWWQFSGFYPPTVNGLGACLIAGLPFLFNTVVGDLCFSATLFGLAAAVVHNPIKSAIWTAFKAAPFRS